MATVVKKRTAYTSQPLARYFRGRALATDDMAASGGGPDTLMTPRMIRVVVKSLPFTLRKRCGKKAASVERSKLAFLAKHSRYRLTGVDATFQVTLVMAEPKMCSKRPRFEARRKLASLDRTASFRLLPETSVSLFQNL